jgi:hypothetical protein
MALARSALQKIVLVAKNVSAAAHVVHVRQATVLVRNKRRIELAIG